MFPPYLRWSERESEKILGSSENAAIVGRTFQKLSHVDVRPRTKTTRWCFICCRTKKSRLLRWPKVMQPDHQRCFASALPSRNHHTKIYRQSFSWQVFADFLNSKQAMFLIMFLRMMFLEKRLPETRIVDVCKDGDADSGAWRGQRFDEVPPAFVVLA